MVISALEKEILATNKLVSATEKLSKPLQINIGHWRSDHSHFKNYLNHDKGDIDHWRSDHSHFKSYLSHYKGDIGHKQTGVSHWKKLSKPLESDLGLLKSYHSHFKSFSAPTKVILTSNNLMSAPKKVISVTSKVNWWKLL